MKSVLKLYSNTKGEITKFLTHFYQKDIAPIKNDLLWEQEYENPIQMIDMLNALIENKDDYKITMWISLDEDLFINVTEKNNDEVIRYLYERYPY